LKQFCLPSNFSTDTIDKYAEINNSYSNSQIIETYGQLAPDSVFGSGRAPKELPEVNTKSLEKYVKYSKDKGIDFNYVINATCMANDELTTDGYKKIENFLIMLQDIGVNWITLALPSVMEIAKHVAPQLNIKASTLCQIDSPTKAEYYEKLGVKRIVLDEDIHRKFNILKDIRKDYTGDIEVIVNSFCLNDCPLKKFHFNSFSHTNIEKDIYSYYHSRCMDLHLEEDSYLKLNWIRPEDIHYYTNLGINHFKLQGRTNVFSGDPVKAVTHYIEEHYDGNLLSLLELFSEVKPMTISETTIDNRMLDGFFNKFVNEPTFCTKVCSKCGYCKSYAKKSISSVKQFFTNKQMSDILLSEFPEILKTDE